MAGVTHSGPCRRHSLVNPSRLEAEQNAAALCSGGRRAAGVREAGGGRGGTRCWSCARDGREAPTLLITVRRQSEDVAGPRRRHMKRFPLFQPESGEPRDQGQESVLAHGQVTSQLGLKSPPPTAPTSPETLHGASSPVRLGPSAAPAAQAPPSRGPLVPTGAAGSLPHLTQVPAPMLSPQRSRPVPQRPRPIGLDPRPGSVHGLQKQGARRVGRAATTVGTGLHTSCACSHFPPRPRAPTRLVVGCRGRRGLALFCAHCCAGACYK